MTTEKDKLLKLAIDTANEMRIKIVDSNNSKHYIGDKELTKEMIKNMIYGEDMNKDEYVYCTNCKYGNELVKSIMFDGTNIPKQCGNCYPYNIEDGMRYEDRPNYKKR